ncbi:unnamed protein product [Prorocentrum cordatum]|uniref:Uncharacterized protein n=1 Tax=Prorocentrum cordatum TaxID=2364126 RepID=A0ABN9T0J0_9DINO|nr:unnamed protein product [Polarella glacialis]
MAKGRRLAASAGTAMARGTPGGQKPSGPSLEVDAVPQPVLDYAKQFESFDKRLAAQEQAMPPPALPAQIVLHDARRICHIAFEKRSRAAVWTTRCGVYFASCRGARLADVLSSG